MMRSFKAMLWLLLGCIAPVMGNVVGGSGLSRPLVAVAWSNTRDVRRSLEDVLDLGMGKGKHHITDVHLAELRVQLRPLFKALPKTSKGRLGHSTVRYALHRHFVFQHGMYVKGLEPNGEAWNSSSPIDIMEDKVPAYVQKLFEERLSDGFELEDLALLAGTLEHFIHMEATQRLQASYRLTGHEDGIEGVLPRDQFSKVITAYLVGFVYGGFDRSIPEAELAKFPTWGKNLAWLRGLEDRVLKEELGAQQDVVSFRVALKVVEAINTQFGQYQNEDCRDMAKVLNAHERHGTGRMRLRTFYEAGWQFSESEEFLRQLGTLDDHFRAQEGPWVIIPNYMVSQTNCLASSSMYTVCCMDPCEDILQHLEARVGAPTATPEDLVHFVGATPSATVSAPRGLSVNLVNHLTEIANNHKGRVPLHGRLFAQWLHHAYPRECVYPQVSGISQPLSAEDWLETHKSISISAEELKELLNEDDTVHAKDLADGNMEDTLPWDEREELVFHLKKPSLKHELKVLGRGVALVASLYAMIKWTMQLVQAVASRRCSGKAPKSMV